MTEEEIDKTVASLKSERRARKRKNDIQQLKNLFSSQAESLKKKFPQERLASALAEEGDRAAEEGVEWMNRCGDILPGILPGIGYRTPNYPLRGLLKAAGIVIPRGLVPGENFGDNLCFPQRSCADSPYFLVGVDVFCWPDHSPQEIISELRKLREGHPLALDEVLAIFYQGIELRERPYQILVLGSLWEKCPLLVKVDEDGGKTLSKVPWGEGIPGDIFIPISAGGVPLLYW